MSWKDRWKQGTKVGSGGNGNTYRATRVDGSDDTVYALKLLHDKLLTNKAKKEQMAREVSKLRKIMPEGWDDVPKIVDAFEENDEQPFIVMDFVEGVTLEKKCKKGPLALPDALDLTLALLTTLERCHGLGITHRDIKDDNIILRGGDPARPVLLDFGLSVEEEDASLTSTEHQVGNRFLALPEHLTPGANKRDPRSDLAQCCGILFFALTGVRPMTLVGADGLQPHRRKEAQEPLRSIDADVLVRLAHAFDIGFRYNIDERWQSVADLREVLLRVRTPPVEVPTPPPNVVSLWTLHVREEKPTGIYFNHDIEKGHKLAPFFGTPGKDARLDTLGRDIREAALSLWSEVTVRPELRGAVRNRHAIDHLCHHWNAHSHLTWNQEIPPLEPPAPVDFEVKSLSAPGQAAVLVLDQAARQSGEEALEAARLKHAEWEKPKETDFEPEPLRDPERSSESVRLRASLDQRSVALMEPVIEFTMTNERKDEVNVSALRVVRKVRGDVRHDFLSTKPSKGKKFRLPGLEQEEFTATWEEIFPDDLDDPCGLDDVTEFYVESIATQQRWKLPEEDLEKVREGVRETLAYRREKTEWIMNCRSCENKTSWMARPPRNGQFGFGGLGEEPGWTSKDFPHQYPMESTGLCPTCSAAVRVDLSVTDLRAQCRNALGAMDFQVNTEGSDVVARWTAQDENGARDVEKRRKVRSRETEEDATKALLSEILSVASTNVVQ